jgi:hypothetical protein
MFIFTSILHVSFLFKCYPFITFLTSLFLFVINFTSSVIRNFLILCFFICFLFLSYVYYVWHFPPFFFIRCFLSYYFAPIFLSLLSYLKFLSLRALSDIGIIPDVRTFHKKCNVGTTAKPVDNNELSYSLYRNNSGSFLVEQLVTLVLQTALNCGSCGTSYACNYSYTFLETSSNIKYSTCVL